MGIDTNESCAAGPPSAAQLTAVFILNLPSATHAENVVHVQQIRGVGSVATAPWNFHNDRKHSPHMPDPSMAVSGM